MIVKHKNTATGAFSRRGFLRLGALAAGVCLVPGMAIASAGGLARAERRLSLFNTHTSERLTTVYWADGKYLPEAIARFNHLLRDHRTGDVKEIDAGLLDLLHLLSAKLSARKPFHVVSGYRSPETNLSLARQNKGVASNSLHVHGKAVDLRLPGIELKALKVAALSIGGGGVGYYGRSNFVHLDVGRVRRWNG